MFSSEASPIARSVECGFVFDDELYVEFNNEKQGPFYPEEAQLVFLAFTITLP